ncbi:hypothetical protein DFP72DRAFT_1012365 [Ephemerocybe angulata]|uniref:BRCT domain-containing protein n=1 Tax=Ephemerocybe angulata TaxID=980116 RepID=A0A8H6HR06_9AGAR|nr:hypothetical protein DFP72DRAFT_1012365 [Tulosesus angulatus]
MMLSRRSESSVLRLRTSPGTARISLRRGVVRTEKFLCAVAAGGFILKKEWAIESAKAGKLLPEEKYALKDPGNKHGVDLQASLERARAGKLFAGKTFYVSGKSVAASIPLLRNVVGVAGGQLNQVQKLTQRIIGGGPERYAVSSADDVSVWRQLSEGGMPVYSVELIIAGTLHQEFDLEKYALPPVESE